MPPTGDIDPSLRVGLYAGVATLTATAGFALSTGEALAGQNRADIDKQALASFGNNALVRTVEVPGSARTSSTETLVPGPNGLVSAQASSDRDPAVEQICLKAGLARPRILEAVIQQPGDKENQAYRLKAEYRPMPEVCHGLYKRIAEYMFEMENPQNNKQMIKIRPYAQIIANGDRVGDEGGVADGYFGTAGLSTIPFKKRYRCTGGPGVRDGATDAFAEMRNTLQYIPDGSIAGRQVHQKRMRIPSVAPDRKTGRVGGRC